MGQQVKKEKKSCLWREYRNQMMLSKMCNPCFELLCYPYSTAKGYGLKDVGVCHSLYPETAATWKAYDPTAAWWENRLKKPISATTNGTIPCDTSNIKRTRNTVNRFVAAPSLGMMNFERQSICHGQRKRSHKMKEETITDEKDLINAKIDALPKNDQNDFYSPLVKRMSTTVNGRARMAKTFAKVAGYKGPITLSTEGTSTTAVSLSKQTLRTASIGFAATINPSNPKATLDRMKTSLKTPRKGYTQLGTISEDQPLYQRLLHQPSSVTATTDGRNRRAPPEIEIAEDGLERNPIWRDRKSMEHASMEQIESVRSDLGPLLLKQLRTLPRPRDRRPYLAALYKRKHTRAAVTNALWQTKITGVEWNKIGIHSVYPGPFQPAEKEPIFRARVSQDKLLKLMKFLDAPDNLVKYAFGSLYRELFGGTEFVHLDKVDRAQSLNTLAVNLVRSLNSEMEHIDDDDLPADEDRCTEVNRDTLCRCLRGRKHEGKCKYTAKHSMSLTTAQNLIASLTSDDMMSLAGLDDTKVEKGRDNFIALKKMADEVYSTDEEATALKDQIDEVEIFHQSEFIHHLGRHGTNACNCLTCGFNDEKSPDDIVCQYTDDHPPSCENCSKGFEVIIELQEEIKNQYEQAQKSFRINYHANSYTELQQQCQDRDLPSNGEKESLILSLQYHDDMDVADKPFPTMRLVQLRKECTERNIVKSGNKKEIIERLQVYEEDIKQYIPKHKMRELTGDERLKLDILEELMHDIEVRKQDFVEYRSHLARHKSEDEYNKSVMENLQDDEAIVTSDYKMKLLSCFFRENQKKFFGKRGTSLLGFMICYNSKLEENKQKGIKDVEFVMMVTDDTLQDENQVIAGKTLLYEEHLPEHITKVHFVSDGAGCYKSKLHRTIQPFYKIWTGVEEVTLRISPAGDGKTNLDGRYGTLNFALSKGVNQGGSYWNAETVIQVAKDAGGVAATEFVLFEPDRSMQLSVKLIHSMDSVLLTVYDPITQAIDAFKHSSYGSGLEIDSVKDILFFVTTDEGKEAIALYTDEGEMNTEEIKRIKPKCRLQEKTRTLKSELPSFLARSGEGKYDANVMAEKSRNRVETRVNKKKLSLEEIRQAKRDAGLFLCNAKCPLSSRYCRAVFLDEWRYNKHVTKDKHNFPKGMTSKDLLVKMASDPGGIVAAGSRVDRSIRTLIGPIVSSTHPKAEKMARCFGQFNRVEGRPAYRKTKKLEEVLDTLFYNDVKLDATAMRKRMKSMRDVDGDGGLMFSHRKRFTNGTLLKEGQITSWVSTRTQEKKKEDTAKGRSAIDLQQQELIDGIGRLGGVE